MGMFTTKDGTWLHSKDWGTGPVVSVGIYDDRFVRTHDWLGVSGMQIMDLAGRSHK
jgi:hypothetical protein